ncbi:MULTISPECIES: chaplin family protein [unclassified Streptomyces]|uniref:chaplin family protein n=1 Tax=unclassified Streptomyces TaxID=2593676 RepID=UPI00369C6102
MCNRHTAAAVTTAALATALAPAAPAAAGGIGDVLSPAFATSCVNLHTAARADGATTHGTGTAAGNLAGLPVGSPLNQCGGADAPVCAIDQWFSGTSILSGHLFKDAGAPADVTAKVTALLTDDSSQPNLKGACG